MNQTERIAVVGLGYVGLPVAVALAEHYPTVGFDVSRRRVDTLAGGHDWTGEIADDALAASTLTVTADPDALADATVIIVTVPTPIDAENRPDLSPIESACRLIGPRLTTGALVVFESTVYPGVTDDVCAPLLEETSGLTRGRDFTLGYSPERINPGDTVHRLATITKIIAAEDEASLARMRGVYGAVVTAGLHEAPSIRVAEAAKVIENTQRDLNIALMNEIALIFDRMEIRTADVLAAAGTKWNFLPFRPGLVGGHCIGVDPYYLTTAAERLGYRPEVILAGRRINDAMGAHVARKTVKLMVAADKPVSGARVGILGLTFKEDVPDLRNSRVPDIVAELADYGIRPLVHDAMADRAEAEAEHGIVLSDAEALTNLDALIVAVAHRPYLDPAFGLMDRLAGGGVLVDLKSVTGTDPLPRGCTRWSL